MTRASRPPDFAVGTTSFGGLASDATPEGCGGAGVTAGVVTGGDTGLAGVTGGGLTGVAIGFGGATGGGFGGPGGGGEVSTAKRLCAVSWAHLKCRIWEAGQAPHESPHGHVPGHSWLRKRDHDW